MRVEIWSQRRLGMRWTTGFVTSGKRMSAANISQKIVEKNTPISHNMLDLRTTSQGRALDGLGSYESLPRYARTVLNTVIPNCVRWTRGRRESVTPFLLQKSLLVVALRILGFIEHHLSRFISFYTPFRAWELLLFIYKQQLIHIQTNHNMKETRQNEATCINLFCRTNYC